MMVTCKEALILISSARSVCMSVSNKVQVEAKASHQTPFSGFVGNWCGPVFGLVALEHLGLADDNAVELVAQADPAGLHVVLARKDLHLARSWAQPLQQRVHLVRFPRGLPHLRRPPHSETTMRLIRHNLVQSLDSWASDRPLCRPPCTFAKAPNKVQTHIAKIGQPEQDTITQHLVATATQNIQEQETLGCHHISILHGGKSWPHDIGVQACN